MVITDTTPKKVRTRREQLRDHLQRCGLRPREAEARASIAQTHISDFRRSGGMPA
jgi:hypothetical protein